MLAADVLWVLGALGLGIGLRDIGAGGGVNFAEVYQIYKLLILAAVVVWTLLYFEMSLDGFKGGWHFSGYSIEADSCSFALDCFCVVRCFSSRNTFIPGLSCYTSPAIFFLLGLVAVRCLVRFLDLHFATEE